MLISYCRRESRLVARRGQDRNIHFFDSLSTVDRDSIEEGAIGLYS